MSRHNKDRRKYLCPCGNRFSTRQVEEVEAAVAHQRTLGVHLPKQLPHSCGRCGKISCLESGKMRYLTPDEEFQYRMDFPMAAAMQDFAIRNGLPDCIGLAPTPKGGPQ